VTYARSVVCVCESVCASVCESVCESVCASVCESVCESVCASVCESVCAPSSFCYVCAAFTIYTIYQNARLLHTWKCIDIIPLSCESFHSIFRFIFYRWQIVGSIPHSVQAKTMNMAFLNIQHAKIHIYVRALAGLDPNQEQRLLRPPLFSSAIDW
jgi:hypothetical protein